MSELDPDVMKKLTKRKYKVGASLQSRPSNIWVTGEFAEEEEEEKNMQRSNSIQIILPVINRPVIGPITTEQEQKI